MTSIAPDSSLTVTGEECPMNYVRTKLALEALRDGQVLEVFLSPGEAERNVPRSAREDGHDVLAVESGGGIVRVLIRKKEGSRGS